MLRWTVCRDQGNATFGCCRILLQSISTQGIDSANFPESRKKLDRSTSWLDMSHCRGHLRGFIEVTVRDLDLDSRTHRFRIRSCCMNAKTKLTYTTPQTFRISSPLNRDGAGKRWLELRFSSCRLCRSIWCRIGSVLDISGARGHLSFCIATIFLVRLQRWAKSSQPRMRCLFRDFFCYLGRRIRVSVWFVDVVFDSSGSRERAVFH